MAKNLQVGDRVFVVTTATIPTCGSYNITRIGKKYAYIRRFGKEEPFCKVTGTSIDPHNSNARVNGRGFDVYASKQDWEAKQLALNKQQQLQKRLVNE